jgi:hypothetical protein
MDKGAETTQKIVITGAIILALVIVLVIGYSLYTKAKVAEGELANKIALDTETNPKNISADVSLTGESKNSAEFSYDGLVQKKTDTSTTTDFEIVNETAEVQVPEETVPEEEAVPPEENTDIVSTTVETTSTNSTQNDGDQPLTQEEIIRIRQLPIDDSPSGNLQTSLEQESGGEYKARY